MIPKNFIRRHYGRQDGQKHVVAWRVPACRWRRRAFFALSDPISMGLKPTFCGEVGHDRQDELSRLFYSAGHAVQKRFARRKGVSRYRRMADRGGHEWPGPRGNHGGKSDSVA